MPTQLLKLALIDTSSVSDPNGADEAVVETFSIYQEGAQGASRQVLSIEANSVEIEDGRGLFESKVYTVDVVGIYSQSKRNQLHTWSKDETPLYFTGYGLDGSILYGYGYLSLVDGFDQNASFRFRFQSEARGGYDSATSIHTSGLSYCSNGFAFYDWAESPDGGTNRPEMFATSVLPTALNEPALSGTDPELSGGDPAVGWSNGWRVQCDGDDDYYTYGRKWFPFSGLTIHFSVKTTVSLTGAGGTGSGGYIQIRPRDKNGNNLANVTESFTSGTSHSASVTLPDGTQNILFTMGTLSDTTIIWNDPMWSIGKVKPFTLFNT